MSARMISVFQLAADIWQRTLINHKFAKYSFDENEYGSNAAVLKSWLKPHLKKCKKQNYIINTGELRKPLQEVVD
jgi:hypothetical protein